GGAPRAPRAPPTRAIPGRVTDGRPPPARRRRRNAADPCDRRRALRRNLRARALRDRPDPSARRTPPARLAVSPAHSPCALALRTRTPHSHSALALRTAHFALRTTLRSPRCPLQPSRPPCHGA